MSRIHDPPPSPPWQPDREVSEKKLWARRLVWWVLTEQTGKVATQEKCPPSDLLLDKNDVKNTLFSLTL